MVTFNEAISNFKQTSGPVVVIKQQELVDLNSFQETYFDTFLWVSIHYLFTEGTQAKGKQIDRVIERYPILRNFPDWIDKIYSEVFTVHERTFTLNYLKQPIVTEDITYEFATAAYKLALRASNEMET